MTRTRTLAATLALAALLSGCGAEKQSSAAADKESSATTDPSPSADPSAPYTSVPDAGGVVALSDDKGLGSPGYWAVKLNDGWEPVVLDQGGRNQAKNPQTSCMVTTQQSQDVGGDGSDAELSRAAVTEQLETLARQSGGTASDVSTVVIPRGALVAEEGAGVEMATGRVDYTRTDNGVKTTSVVAARRFTSTTTVMYAVLNCPTARISTREAAEAALQRETTISTQ